MAPGVHVCVMTEREYNVQENVINLNALYTCTVNYIYIRKYTCIIPGALEDAFLHDYTINILSDIRKVL